MLRLFRNKITSWLMLAFLGLAVLALVFGDVGSSLGGFGGGAPADEGETLAEVGGEEVTSAELERTIRRQLEAARQQNPELDLGRFLAAGAYEGLLEQMIVARALWAFGQEQGLTVSDRMIDRLIASIPAFRNFAGQFDEDAFRQALARQNLTERQLRRELADLLMQRQLQMPIGLAARVPESVAVQYASLMLERRRGTIGVVPAEALAAGIAPSDAEVAAFYRDNRVRYTVPERRVLRYALIGRDQVAQNARATDEEIQAHYRQNQARYAGSESRTLQQVVLQDEARARDFAQRARGDFAAAAQQAGFGAADIDLGRQSREQYANLANAEVANAVFSAQQGAVVGPLRSALGWHVVRVAGIERAAARPLATVRGEIAAEIERRKIEDALGALLTRVEERVGDGASFEEVVQAERLETVETPPVTAAGAAPGAEWQAPAELQGLLRGAFQMDPDAPEPAIETLEPNQRYALVSVVRTEPAAVPPLRAIAAQVRADLVRRRASERARAAAERIAAAINSGTPASRAFAEAGVRLPPPERVDARRVDIAQRGREVPPPLITLFSIPQGRARTLEGPNGAGWFVIHHEQRTAGQASCPQAERQAAQPSEGCRLIQAAQAEFSGQAGSEYAEQFARAAQARVGVERNEQAIARARQRLQAGTAAAQ